MSSLRRAAERSLRSIGDEEATANRTAEIAKARPLKRMGLAAIDAVTRSKPNCTATVLGLRRHLPELEEIDETWQSTVYRLDAETVLKVLDTSASMTRFQRRDAVARMRDEHAAYTDFLGSAVLPHDVDIGSHPLQQTCRVIRITQPYRELDFLQLNEDEPSEIPALAARLDEAHGRYPRILDEVRQMLRGSRALYDAHALSTDIIGNNNMGVALSSGSFTIIDGQPVTEEHPAIQARMNRCFDNLETALSLAG